MKRVRLNAEAAECVRYKQEFSNRTGKLWGKSIVVPGTCRVDRFVVFSGASEVWPIYVYDFGLEKWFGNNACVDVKQSLNYKGGKSFMTESTLGRHTRQVMPTQREKIVWLSYHEMVTYNQAGAGAVVSYKMRNAS